MAVGLAETARRADATARVLRSKGQEESHGLVWHALQRAAKRASQAKKAKNPQPPGAVQQLPGVVGNSSQLSGPQGGAQPPGGQGNPLAGLGMLGGNGSAGLGLLGGNGSAGLQLPAGLGILGGNGSAGLQLPAPTQDPAIRRQRKAQCSFSVIESVQVVTLLGFYADLVAKTCAKSDAISKKLCTLNGLLLSSVILRLAAFLAEAATNCAEQVNLKAACAVPPAALTSLITMQTAAGILIKNVCNPDFKAQAKVLIPLFMGTGAPGGAGPGMPGAGPGAPGVGPGAPSGRRLFLGGGPTSNLGQCVLDGTQVAWSLARVGLGLSNAIQFNCPPTGVGYFFRVAQASCAIDISLVLSGLAEVATFVSMAIIHCIKDASAVPPEAFCATGVSATVAVAASLSVVANGFYGACHLGLNAKPSISDIIATGLAGVKGGGGAALGLEEGGAAFGLEAARRLGGRNVSRRQRQVELAQSYGFNASDPTSVPSFAHPTEAMEALQAFAALQAEDISALKQRFGRPEDVWKHINSELSPFLTAATLEEESLDRDDRDFLELVEPLLSEEDLRHVGAGPTAHKATGLFEMMRSSRKCH